jgi:hypothetical protein
MRYLIFCVKRLVRYPAASWRVFLRNLGFRVELHTVYGYDCHGCPLKRRAMGDRCNRCGEIYRGLAGDCYCTSYGD